MRAIRRTLLLAALAAVLATVGCEASSATGDVSAGWLGEEEARGDTLVVRTLAGSVWGDTMRLVPEVVIGELDGEDPYVFGQLMAVDTDGEGRIWVADSQARQIRVFDADGSFLRVVGRAGQGPGEYARPDGLRIAGGEVVVRDQQGGRFLVYSLEGEHLRSWRLGGGFSTSAPFHLDGSLHLLNPDIRRDRPLDDPDRSVLVRYVLATGEAVDTLPWPNAGPPAPSIVQEIRTEGRVGRYSSSVPFHPSGTWTMTTEGALLLGPGDRYALYRQDPDGDVLLIERLAEPAPVHPDEAEWARENVARGFRARDASWRWDGPDIPTVKPPYRWIGAGVDGSFWVLRHVRGVESENPTWSPEAPPEVPRTGWREPPVADVFDPDGRYLGPVRLPDGFSSHRPAVLAVDGPVIITPHELGYDQVVRYRLEALADG